MNIKAKHWLQAQSRQRDRSKPKPPAISSSSSPDGISLPFDSFSVRGWTPPLAEGIEGKRLCSSSFTPSWTSLVVNRLVIFNMFLSCSVWTQPSLVKSTAFLRANRALFSSSSSSVSSGSLPNRLCKMMGWRYTCAEGRPRSGIPSFNSLSFTLRFVAIHA